LGQGILFNLNVAAGTQVFVVVILFSKIMLHVRILFPVFRKKIAKSSVTPKDKFGKLPERFSLSCKFFESFLSPSKENLIGNLFISKSKLD